MYTKTTVEKFEQKLRRLSIYILICGIFGNHRNVGTLAKNASSPDNVHKNVLEILGFGGGAGLGRGVEP